MLLVVNDQWAYKHPIIFLGFIFAIWKLILLTIACTSPYPGYDTSSSLLFPSGTHDREYPDTLHTIAVKLTRWDAIYFAQAAHRGALFEQEWAFGWGYTKILEVLSHIGFGSHAKVIHIAFAGILVSNISHALSVLVLYHVTLLLAAGSDLTRSPRVAFISACLHIISPAGIFLSAPYAESSFALMSFCGYYLYALSHQAHYEERAHLRDTVVVLSGLFFGLASTLRSNGLLSGLLFCFDLIICVVDYLQSGGLLHTLRRSIVIVLAGALVGICFLFPQYLAYREFCVEPEAQYRASWCTNRIPSIYTWVQDRYWNVGLLRYWTVSNAPLFLLAAPMLFIMLLSAQWIWSLDDTSGTVRHMKAKDSRTGMERHWISSSGIALARRLALPQLIMGVLALTTYHVQVVTRLSSGYPLWYWWLAMKIVGGEPVRSRKWRIPTKVVVRWMVLYATIQAGLFAAFLPPA